MASENDDMPVLSPKKSLDVSKIPLPREKRKATDDGDKQSKKHKTDDSSGTKSAEKHSSRSSSSKHQSSSHRKSSSSSSSAAISKLEKQMADLGKQVSQMSAVVLKLNSLQQPTSAAANLPQTSGPATQQKPSQGLSGYKIPKVSRTHIVSSPDDDDEDDDEEDDDDDEDDDSEGGGDDDDDDDNEDNGPSAGTLRKFQQFLQGGSPAPTSTKSSAANVVVSMLRKIHKLDEAKGDAIDTELAKLFVAMLKSPADETELEKKCREWPIPNNEEMSALEVNKVDSSVWERLPTYFQKSEAGFQKVQQFINKSLIPQLRILDKCKDDDSALAQYIVTTIGDSILFDIAALQKLGKQRKKLFKPFLKKKFKKLADNPAVPGQPLFGENLSDQVSAISAADTITDKIIQTPKKAKKPDVPFLGKGRGNAGPKKQQNQQFKGKGRGKAKGQFKRHGGYDNAYNKPPGQQQYNQNVSQ